MEFSDFQFILGHFYMATHIPCRILQNGGYAVVCGNGYIQAQEPFVMDEGLSVKTWSLAISSFSPQLVSEGTKLFYGIFYDGRQSCVALGPVCYEEMTEAERSDFVLRHHLKAAERTSYNETKEAKAVEWTPFITTKEAFASAILLAYYLFTGKRLMPETIGFSDAHNYDLEQNRLELYHYDYVAGEEEKSQITYRREQAALQTIRDGDPEAAQARSLDLSTVEALPHKAENLKKHYEYLACSTIAVAAHVAMDSGVRAELAYSLIDMGQRRLSKCRTIQEMISLMQDSMVGLAYCVKSSRGHTSAGYYTESCREYISRHLYAPFTVRDMAKDLGFHPNYLSSKFSKETGISIMQYVRKRRMEVAANLLRYSDMDIDSIAQHLCYATQSHFGVHFRAEYGVSPQKFRIRERGLQ